MKLKQALPFIIACSAAKLKPSINKENMSSWQIEIPSDNYQYSFNVNLTDTCQIDWGDGIIEYLNKDTINNIGSATHTYNTGTYIIRLEQYHDILNFANTAAQHTIIRMLYMSDNITTYENMFYECNNLIEIADTCIIQSARLVEDENGQYNIYNINFASMFYGCTSLRAIYGNYTISFNCQQNYSYEQWDGGLRAAIFRDCTSLKIIQPTLDFSYCTHIPYVFYNCSQLDILNINTLPDCLVDGSRMFYECNNLLLDISNLLPSNGIGNHGSVTSYSQIYIEEMFKNCSYLYGTAPAYILWESGKDNIESNDMFKGCTNLSNYSDIPYTYGGIAAIITNTYYSLDIANGNNLMLEYSYNSQHSIEFSSTNASEYGFDVSSDGTITMTSPSDGEFSFSINITTTDTNTGYASTIQKYITINVINASYAGGGSGGDGIVNESIITQYQVNPVGTDSGNGGYYQVQIDTAEPNTAISIDWGDGNSETFTSDEYNSRLYLSHQYDDSYGYYIVVIKGNHTYVDIYDGPYSQFITRVDYYIVNN